MLKTSKTINLTGQSMIGEKQVVYMNASISTDGNQNITVNKSIMDQALYSANKVEARQDISDFEDQVYLIEDDILGGTI